MSMRDRRVTKRAVEVAEEIMDAWREDMDRMNNITNEAIGLADEANNRSEELLNIGHKVLDFVDRQKTIIDFLWEKSRQTGRHTEALTGDELQRFAEAVPQWRISSTVADGRARKVYGRTIDQHELVAERRIGGPLEHDTYLNFADGEHTDIGLSKIFDSYYIDGNYWNGKYFELSIEAGEAGPITYGDLAKVLDAEEYLVTAGYILPPNEVIEPVGA